MNDLQSFEGDLLLFDTQDGGDISIADGFFVNDRAFNTAVYLSLFGGNKDDSGKVKNKNEWWGNLLPETTAAEKLVSRFQAIIAGMPMSAKNIREAENAAELDLKWITEEGIAQSVEIDGRAGAGNKFFLNVAIRADGKSIYDNTFALFWKAGIYGGV
jgi:phage gp46-like protein